MKRQILGAVATENLIATDEAWKVLERGGTAADAAVVAALVLGITTPVSSGVGGGGFALVWNQAEKNSLVLDFRETSPAAFDAKAFEKKKRPKGLLVGVPGELRGLEALHKHLGKLPFGSLVKQAAGVADRGVPLSQHMARALGLAETKARGLRVLGTTFFPGGKPMEAGSRFRRARLAKTLNIVAEKGVDAFYNGPIARSLVGAVREAGGSLSLDDLANYKVQERIPLHEHWGEVDVMTMPPPSAGGVMMLQALSAFPPDKLAKLDLERGEDIHHVAEVLRGAFVDRLAAVGDPKTGKVRRGWLLSNKRLAARNAKYDADKTRPMKALLDGIDHGTSHLVIADKAGNVVTLTTTVNTAFGSAVVDQRTGVVLNDELSDFPRKAWLLKAGVPITAAGVARPNTRPPSSMVPTLVVKDQRVRFAWGGSGGLRIATGSTLTALKLLGLGHSIGKAITSSRFHIGPRGKLIFEKGALPKSLEEDLVARGEQVKVAPNISAIQGVAIDYKDGQPVFSAQADPRKFGKARSE